MENGKHNPLCSITDVHFYIFIIFFFNVTDFLIFLETLFVSQMEALHINKHSIHNSHQASYCANICTNRPLVSGRVGDKQQHGRDSRQHSAPDGAVSETCDGFREGSCRAQHLHAERYEFFFFFSTSADNFKHDLTLISVYLLQKPLSAQCSSSRRGYLKVRATSSTLAPKTCQDVSESQSFPQKTYQ